MPAVNQIGFDQGQQQHDHDTNTDAKNLYGALPGASGNIGETISDGDTCACTQVPDGINQ